MSNFNIPYKNQQVWDVGSTNPSLEDTFGDLKAAGIPAGLGFALCSVNPLTARGFCCCC